MSALSIQVPFPVFNDRDGQPLDNGYVWIGVPNLSPQTNPVNVYFDEALTILAPQPLRTINGYISRFGSPAQVYIDGVNFSILVQDNKGSIVYSFPEATGIAPDATGISFTGFKGQSGFVSDLADDDGADWIGFDPSGSDAVARSAQDKMREIISVKDFGAVGDGVVDDTVAFQDAINSVATGTTKDILLPDGVYKITGTIFANNKFANFMGQSPSGAIIDFAPASPNQKLFDLSYLVSYKQQFSFTDLTIRTSVPSAGTAITIRATPTSESVQVNGEADTLYVNRVRVTQNGSGYWVGGLHTIDTGGVHASQFSINNSITAAQTDANTFGVFIQGLDSRISVIRAFTVTDLYVLRAFYSVKTQSATGKLIESIYIFGGELVGINGSAFKFIGECDAVAISGIHVDSCGKVLDAEGARCNFVRFFGCDLRKGNNGSTIQAGAMFELDAGEMLTVGNCTFAGGDVQIPDVSNLAFKFNNIFNGSYYRRGAFSGNVFRNFYGIFGDSGSASKITSSGNAYAFIRGQVYADAVNDNGINKLDGIIAKTFTVSLTGSSSQTVDVNCDENLSSDKPAIGIMQQASAFASDLTVRYDFDSSTKTNAVFIVSNPGLNTGTVRFSVILTPILGYPTSN
jgi:hypothetical protein